MDASPFGSASRPATSEKDTAWGVDPSMALCATGAVEGVTRSDVTGNNAERVSSRESNDAGFCETNIGGNSTMVLRESQLEREERVQGRLPSATKVTCEAGERGHDIIQREFEILQQRREVLSIELELAKTKLLLSQMQTVENSATAANDIINHASVTYSPARPTFVNSNRPQHTYPISASDVNRTTTVGSDTQRVTDRTNREAFSIRELIPIAPKFNPGESKGLTSSQWVKAIEELKEVYEISDKAALLVASSNLSGAAKFWMQSCQSRLTSWQFFKEEIRKAFPTTYDEAEVHSLLSKRYKQPSETFEEYYFEVRSIASRAALSTPAILKYLINGIPDRELRTSLSLQTFTEPDQLLRQFKAYEETKRLHTEQRSVAAKNEKPTSASSHNNKKCYNCNETGHISINCPKPARKKRCSKCHRVGHEEGQCKSVATSAGARVSLVHTDEYHKEVTINHHIKTTAFIDLGSDITLVTEGFANRHNLRTQPCNIPLRSFGNGKYSTIRRSTVHLRVDRAEAVVDVHIVDDGLMCVDVIVGRNFCDLENVKVLKTFGRLDITNVDVPRPTGNEGALDNDPTLLLIDDEPKPLVEKKNITDSDINGDSGTTPKIQDSVLKVSTLHTLPDLPVEEINCDDLEQEQRRELIELLQKYRQCFARNIFELGCSRNFEIKIELAEKKIVAQRPYRLAYAQHDTVRKILLELLQADIIEESKSNYSSPALLVKKANGEDRLVIDYRKVNALIVKDRYPLPVIEDLLQQLNGGSYFIVLDFASGYYQLPVARDSRKYTAFITPDGMYEFKRMPFGLCNAPSEFQRVMNHLKSKVRSGNVVVYMDDVLIPCDNFQHGLVVLTEFLEVLSNEGLTLKLRKSFFFKKTVEFLGYEVSEGGVRPGQRKISAVRDFRTPSNAHELRQFIGLTSYFRKFVPEHAVIAAPLTKLLRKDAKFHWEAEQTKAFEVLKTILTTRPVLTLYNPNLEHEVHTDASSCGLAGILLQLEKDGTLRPISYFSRQTTLREKVFHSFELELLAIVETLTRYRTFLLGKKFKVVTDCESVKACWKKAEIIPRIARWILKLTEFDFEMEYRKGKSLRHVDSLSRQPSEESEPSYESERDIFSLTIDSKDWLLTVQLNDPKLRGVVEILSRKPVGNDEKQVHQDYQMKNNRLWRRVAGELKWTVPKDAVFRIIRTCHDEVGHPGLERTLQRLKRDYWFPRMRNRVKRYISSCTECAYYKRPVGKEKCELHCVEKIPIPFDTIHLDHLGPFVKTSQGNTHILGIIDGFTKYCILQPVRNTKTTPVLRVLCNTFSHFGAPRRMITDRGTAFTSKEFKEFCERNCIQHILTAVRTPRANGQIERCNKTVLDALRTMADGSRDWDKLLHSIQWGINSIPNNSTRLSPHEILFGYRPRDPLGNKVLLALQENDAAPSAIDLNEIRRIAAENIASAQREQKIRFDSKRDPPRKYNKDDLVLVERPSIATGESRKLDPKYKGPYIVSAVLNNDRYVLTDIPGAPRNQRGFESVYSSDKLKPWCTVPEDVISDSEDEYNQENEDVLQSQDGRVGTPKFSKFEQSHVALQKAKPGEHDRHVVAC